MESVLPDHILVHIFLKLDGEATALWGCFGVNKRWRRVYHSLPSIRFRLHGKFLGLHEDHEKQLEHKLKLMDSLEELRVETDCTAMHSLSWITNCSDSLKRLCLVAPKSCWLDLWYFIFKCTKLSEVEVYGGNIHLVRHNLGGGLKMLKTLIVHCSDNPHSQIITYSAKVARLNAEVVTMVAAESCLLEKLELEGLAFHVKASPLVVRSTSLKEVKLRRFLCNGGIDPYHLVMDTPNLQHLVISECNVAVVLKIRCDTLEKLHLTTHFRRYSREGENWQVIFLGGLDLGKLKDLRICGIVPRLQGGEVVYTLNTFLRCLPKLEHLYCGENAARLLQRNALADCRQLHSIHVEFHPNDEAGIQALFDELVSFRRIDLRNNLFARSVLMVNNNMDPGDPTQPSSHPSSMRSNSYPK